LGKIEGLSDHRIQRHRPWRTQKWISEGTQKKQWYINYSYRYSAWEFPRSRFLAGPLKWQGEWLALHVHEWVILCPFAVLRLLYRRWRLFACSLHWSFSIDVMVEIRRSTKRRTVFWIWTEKLVRDKQDKEYKITS
jgi:hypothetical protein